LNIKYYAFVFRKLNSELVCLVPLGPQVNNYALLPKISDKILQPPAVQDAAY